MTIAAMAGVERSVIDVVEKPQHLVQMVGCIRSGRRVGVDVSPVTDLQFEVIANLIVITAFKKAADDDALFDDAVAER